MGCFSWLDAVTEKPVYIDDPIPSYLLVPSEFSQEYGEKLKESWYEGYGIFSGVDVYELVVLINRKFLLEKPDYIVNNNIEAKDKDWYSIVTNLSLDRDQLIYELSKIGTKLRYIGIDLACYDCDNSRLKYPIKIVHNPNLKYEDVKGFSKGDPNQGLGDF